MKNNGMENKIYEDLINGLKTEIIENADANVKNGKVNISKVIYEDKNNYEIYASVKSENENYKTYIQINNSELENLSCTCDEYKNTYGACNHIVATLKEFINNPSSINKFCGDIVNKNEENENNEDINMNKSYKSSGSYKVFNQLAKEFYKLSEEKEENESSNNIEGTIKLEPKIIYNQLNNNLKLEIKIGETQLYKVKSLPEFYERFVNKDQYKYGSKLDFIHVKEKFINEDKKILDFVLKYAEIIKYANEASTGYDYYTNRLGEDAINISNTGLDDLFEALENKEVLMENQGFENKITFIPEEPNVKFKLSELNDNEYRITTNIDVYSYILFEGKKYEYILMNKKLYRCSKKYKDTVIKLLETFRKNFTKGILLPKEELTNFFSVIEPFIKKELDIDKKDYEKIQRYIPAELYSKLYLDYSGQNYVLANIKFIYGDIEINPLDSKLDEEQLKVSRNSIKESKLLNMFIKSGFMFDQKNNRLVLANDDKIYEFLSNDLNEYMKYFEVLATDKFKEKEIIGTTSISMGVKIENNLLDIDFSNFKIDIKELSEIMKKYKLKKKYHRLKNGDFIKLEENDTLKFIDSITEDIDIDYDEITDNNIKLPMYRALYLDKILENNNFIRVTKDEKYKQLINDSDIKQIEGNIQLPKNLNASLREYQKVGVEWLLTLDKYGLGGILADDMGLGKTIQLLSVISKYIEDHGKKPTIVVCPSSLCLNWQNEIEKFTSGVSSLVIHGNLEERNKQIAKIPKYNIVITSYELLKRDIEEYKKYDYSFKYIIADEAQYIKNNNTQNAKAIKSINAEIRYALTGTPIENSLSELWSIFDFIMPGYLFGYKKFKELYETPIVKEEDRVSMNKLKKLIEPFVLRRIKGEVLTELPDKVITILNSQMVDEQKNIYLSYLEKAKKNAIEEIKEKGLEKSQIKILALITRLRQICCHPSLFVENYKDGSGKLNQCIEIIKDAIESGHKILLFSGYTAMFDIIEKELKKEKIDYLKLTGQTKVFERLDLVDEFNNNPDKKLFLISLKAGGTGLNLVGADVVIHYDPWWNISAENQATDRTYRIGQKRNVQVYKLITKNSIEEKIYELQKRKETLIDNMLSTKQTFISKLSKEDIMKLFEQ